jgi:hypothetical protein
MSMNFRSGLQIGEAPAVANVAAERLWKNTTFGADTFDTSNPGAALHRSMSAGFLLCEFTPKPLGKRVLGGIRRRFEPGTARSTNGHSILASIASAGATLYANGNRQIDSAAQAAGRRLR